MFIEMFECVCANVKSDARAHGSYNVHYVNTHTIARINNNLYVQFSSGAVESSCSIFFINFDFFRLIEYLDYVVIHSFLSLFFSLGPLFIHVLRTIRETLDLTSTFNGICFDVCL